MSLKSEQVQLDDKKSIDINHHKESFLPKNRSSPLMFDEDLISKGTQTQLGQFYPLNQSISTRKSTLRSQWTHQFNMPSIDEDTDYTIFPRSNRMNRIILSMSPLEHVNTCGLCNNTNANYNKSDRTTTHVRTIEMQSKDGLDDNFVGLYLGRYPKRTKLNQTPEVVPATLLISDPASTKMSVEASDVLGKLDESTRAINDHLLSLQEDCCKNLNFARRNQCNRCNKERVLVDSAKKKLGSEIGKAAAEKSRGLFSAEDWECGKCGNVNWARRQICNMCNAPKFTDEERTGYGGGYNERERVEYKEHVEASDDEYDEFGRRKKRDGKVVTTKAISNDSQQKTEPAPARIRDSDEEESDEDSDDGNLAKYDLWGDEDEDISNSNSKQQQPAIDKKEDRSSSTSSDSSSSSSSRSRSQSRSKSFSRSSSKSNSQHKSSSIGRDRKSKSSSHGRRSSSRTRNCTRSRSRSPQRGSRYNDGRRR